MKTDLPQLGGACELGHDSADHNEMIHTQDAHPKDVVTAGDTAHEPALPDMKTR